MNAAEAEDVVAAAAQSGRRVLEAFHDHYHPLSTWVRQFLASDALGVLHRAEAVFTGPRPSIPARSGTTRRSVAVP